MKVVRAAGGLVWRPGPDGPQVALVHRPAYDDWSFPKGKLEPGEAELDAAVREVGEETGLRVRVGEDLGTIAYRDAKDRPKVVRYWVMTPDDGDELRPAHEVDEALWVELDRAVDVLSYDHDRRVLGRLEARV